MRPELVCVTGGNGFIGRALVQHLAAQGWPVRATIRAADRDFDTSIEVASGMALSADTDWRPALTGVTHLVHTAARVHVSLTHDAEALARFRAVNVAATMRLARQSLESGVRRFVFLSSIGVNGPQTFAAPFAASDLAHPVTSYARSKHEAELALRDLTRASGMELVILRPPLVYGADAPGNFGRLVRYLRRGLPLPLAGVSNQRSLIALDNLVDLITLCLTHPHAADRLFLASDGEDVSTPELLRRLGVALGRPARLFGLPEPFLRSTAALLGQSTALQQLCASLQIDARPTRSALDWTPPLSLDQGLVRVAGPYK